MTFQNIPDRPHKLEDLIQIIDKQVLSAAIFNNDDINISIFGFADLENISEEQYAGDTLFYIITGTCTIKTKNDNLNLKAGDICKIEKNTLHEIHAENSFKMLQITLKKA